MQMPDKSRFNLIDNFHWESMKIRRRKGLSHAQLAQAIHESAVALQMIEKGKLPENSGIIIKKIEQFFQINLRNMADFQTYDEKQKPVLLDEQGKELEIIPEEEKELMEEMRGKFPSQTRDISAISSSEGIDIKKAHTAGVTIGDLKALHRKKILATRQEQIEEQQKIEERKRILEAQREKDRIKLEERQKKEQEMKMKTEEMRKKLADEKKQELLKKREKEFNDIDKKLGGVELLD
jgi:transcriptional regulator with XRE-family HTH domain